MTRAVQHQNGPSLGWRPFVKKVMEEMPALDDESSQTTSKTF